MKGIGLLVMQRTSDIIDLGDLGVLTLQPNRETDEIKNILADVKEIRDIMLEIGATTQQQRIQLDKATECVSDAKLDTTKGNTDLLKAREYNKKHE
uniref:t-SNARE coiled-coil homology domain-containing protein n=1 Tax=Marseillevirus LCMAC201 TaxID=2506605 RepID=A0A481YXT3_9VIRU|nr:MAG: hypothetical protein LCMAC201_01980 [Marseillevirus LCMAC201]